MKKIISMLFTLVLVVYVSISFGNEIVTLTISKTNMQSTASINLYQHQDAVPFTVIDTSLPQPWTLTSDLVTVNDVVTIHAVPVNGLGQEGSSSPEFSFSRLPDGSDITIEIKLGE
jgi:hypothetical protein